MSQRWGHLVAFVAVVAAATIGTLLAGWYANHRAIEREKDFAHRFCLDVNESRKQGNVRADVLKMLLIKLRDPVLAEQVHPSPLFDC